MNDSVEPKKTYHREFRYRRGIGFPLLLVAVGVILFLNSINVIQGNVWDLLIRLWPVLIIISGLDGIVRGDGYVGSVFWTGVGVALLLWSLGLLAPYGITGWDLLRLWPALLVAWGLDIIIGRRYGWLSALTGIVVGLVLVGGTALLLMHPAMISPATVTSELTQKLGGANRIYPVTVNINTAVSRLRLSSGENSPTDPDQFLSGVLHLQRGETFRQNYTVSADMRGTYTLESGENAYFWLPASNSYWDLRTNPQIPINLYIKTAVGGQELDISTLSIKDLKAEMAVGKIILFLPQKGNFNVDISVAVGEVFIFVPKDSQLCIQADTAVTALTYPNSYRRDGNRITSPSVNPAESCIRLHIQDVVGIVQIQER